MTDADRPPSTVARRWWALAIAWFLAVGLGWAWYGVVRADDRDRQARQQAWVDRIVAVQAVQPPEGGVKDVQPPDPARLMADVGRLSFERYTPAQRKTARALIAHALTDMGFTPDLHGYGTGINIIAERPGTDPEAKAVLVAAHFDTVQGSPGADDNASGVAVVLEVARRLKDVSTRRPLRVVFFDEEEQGLVGSAAYARSPLRMAELAAVIVVEMAGFTCKEKGCQRFPPGLPPGLAPDVGDFIAVIGDLENVKLLEAFRRAARPDRPAVFALPVPDKGDPLPDTRRSDHAPFWDAGVGAVMVTDTAELRNPHYHRPSDTPETLDPAFLAGVAAIVVDATRALLDAGSPPRGGPAAKRPPSGG